jgi:hypothetical protein
MRHTNSPIFARVVEELEGGLLWSVCFLPPGCVTRARNLARQHGRPFRLPRSRALQKETAAP